MSHLSGKHVLLIVSGGIAAYKTLELIRRLRERGAIVTAVLTKAAKQFVTPLSVASLSGRNVYDDLFSLTDETEMGHIQLSRSSDFVVVAPATADLMAKSANGLADDLASTLLLATDKAAIFVPAMNVRMWTHPATQRNLAALRAAGCAILGPADGEMACGEFGPGRMLEPLEIISELERLVVGTSRQAPRGSRRRQARNRHRRTDTRTDRPRSLHQQQIVRKTGLRDRGGARRRGRRYCSRLRPGRHGSAARRDHPQGRNRRRHARRRAKGVAGRHFHSSRSRRGLAGEKRQRAKDQEGPERPADHRTHRESRHPGDGIADEDGRPKLVVGFAAETENLIPNAQAKLARKKCDLIIANDVGAEQAIFGGDLNRVVVVDSAGAESWPQVSKAEVATKIAALVAARLGGMK